MRYSFEIDIKNSKAKAFLNYIATLDFIKLKKEDDQGDWWNDISEETKKEIELSLKQIEDGEIISHKEVMQSVDKVMGR